ncbi:MAG: NAD(P)/FAD-dependent oxidoreductase [Dehalococcoidales bacterium]|nr:NAD(P)/FAD-dependent oxidoreductase [Dehalococcoidales bacterium]
MAIIGGGPTGSQVAYKLAGMGYRAIVVERKENLGERVCCTGIVSQECANSFAIDESVIFRRVNSAKVFSPSGKLLNLWRREPQACILDRGAFNATFASRAQCEGAEYVLNSSVKGVEVGSDRVRIKTTRDGEGISLFEAKVVVIATGFAGHRLTEKMGLGKVSDLAMGAQAEVETSGVDEVEVYFGQEIAPGFFAWLVPTSPGRALVGLLSRRSPRLYLEKFMSSLLAHGKIVSSDTRINSSGVLLKPLARTYGDRVIVVGTAAGQVKPTTGGGIYFGLLCADIAVECLHQALESDDLAKESLSNYEREWKKKLGKELRAGYWARKFSELLSDRQFDRIFDIIKANDIDEALLKDENLSFDWHAGALSKLMKHEALSKVVGALKVSLR